MIPRRFLLVTDSKESSQVVLRQTERFQGHEVRDPCAYRPVAGPTILLRRLWQSTLCLGPHSQ